MKNSFVIVSFACIALYACNVAGDKPVVKKHTTDWDDEGLKGQVKSLSERQYCDTCGIDTTCLIAEYISVFDSSGNKLEEYDHYPHEDSYRIVNVYNRKGQNISTKEYTYHGMDTSKMTTLRVYNSKGDLIEDRFDSIAAPVTKYIYDSVGNLKAFYSNTPDDTTYVINGSYKYDSKGNVIETDYYFPSGILQSRRIDIFNNDGQRIKSEMYYDNDSIASKGGVKRVGSGDYDANGHRIDWIEYKPDGSIKMKFEYKTTCDTQGNMIKQVVLKNGKPSTHNEFEIVYY